MLMDALCDSTVGVGVGVVGVGAVGVGVRYRTDNGLFNVRKLKAKTMAEADTVCDLLFADDCVLYAGSQSDMLYAGLQSDMLYAGSQSDMLYAGSQSDMLYAGLQSDMLYAGSQSDMLYAGLQSDMLYAGSQSDMLYAGLQSDMLYAGSQSDMLYAGLQSDMQHCMDLFSTACDNSGLTMSTKKTEVMHWPAPGRVYAEPTITVTGQKLSAVDSFIYLGKTRPFSHELPQKINEN